MGRNNTGGTLSCSRINRKNANMELKREEVVTMQAKPLLLGTVYSQRRSTYFTEFESHLKPAHSYSREKAALHLLSFTSKFN